LLLHRRLGRRQIAEQLDWRRGRAALSRGELLQLDADSLHPRQQLLRPRQRFVRTAHLACSSRTSLPRIPFTSLAASSDAYRFASVTASSRTTSTGTFPSSSSSSATRRTLRSTAPRRSAVHSSDAHVMRASRMLACSVTASASSRV